MAIASGVSLEHAAGVVAERQAAYDEAKAAENATREAHADAINAAIDAQRELEAARKDLYRVAVNRHGGHGAQGDPATTEVATTPS